jgi:hypothetical protein
MVTPGAKARVGCGNPGGVGSSASSRELTLIGGGLAASPSSRIPHLYAEAQDVVIAHLA